VRLPGFLCQQLGAHLADRPHGPADLVFTAPTAGPLQHRTFYRRHFRRAVGAAGLPEALRFHDLRHTAAALLTAQGAHPRAIMERLGHSSITISLNVYGHLFPNLDEALTDGLEATFRQAEKAGRATDSRAPAVQMWCRTSAPPPASEPR
jgi:integrase